MPDEATVRDLAKKLERWAAALPEDERSVVEGWMALGLRSGEPAPHSVWWFEPSHHADVPSAREAG